MKAFTRIVAALVAMAVSLGAWASQPRYVFYFIGDGMGNGHVMSAESYNRNVRGADEPLLMLRFPVVSQCTTFSASSPVTDSAAAGTALSTGHKTKNGMLGMGPDSVAVSSIAKDLYDRGWGVGVVTSVSPDDATPGAFYAHQPYRKMFYEIGLDAARSGYDFLAGANLRGAEGTDLLEQMERNGVAVVRGLDQLARTDSKKVFLLNTDSVMMTNIGYTIDSIPGVLTLPQITGAALAHLRKNSPAQFFLMVEGGNIDHAAHANDGGGVIKEILNFNEALALAYDFYLEHPDETLIVVTADHDTGGMSLGNRYLGYNANLGLFDSQRISKDRFSDWCKGIMMTRQDFSWDDMKQNLEAYLGFWKTVPVTEKQTEELRQMFEKTFEYRNSQDEKGLYNSFNAFAVAVYRVLNDLAGIGFTTGGHTGNFVPVYAVGVGAERFQGLNDNTELPRKIMEIVN